jgi:hypothetical protein
VGWALLHVPKDVVKLILVCLDDKDLREVVLTFKYLWGCAKDIVTARARAMFDKEGKFAGESVPLAIMTSRRIDFEEELYLCDYSLLWRSCSACALNYVAKSFGRMQIWEVPYFH